MQSPIVPPMQLQLTTPMGLPWQSKTCWFVSHVPKPVHAAPGFT